jgi:hypothetical protein
MFKQLEFGTDIIGYRTGVIPARLLIPPTSLEGRYIEAGHTRSPVDSPCGTIVPNVNGKARPTVPVVFETVPDPVGPDTITDVVSPPVTLQYPLAALGATPYTDTIVSFGNALISAGVKFSVIEPLA